MKYSISIAMAVILMAAAFAGVIVATDDSDAATNPISIKGDDTYDNEISIVDGKIVGTLNKNTVYSFTIVIGDVAGKNVYYTVPCECQETPADEAEATEETTGAAHVVDVKESDKGEITFSGTKDAVKAQIKVFQFIVTSSEIALDDQVAAEVAFDNMYKDMGQTIAFDLNYSEDIIEIRYIVGDLIYVKTAMVGQPYTLVTLDSLSAPTPEGQKFVGWEFTAVGGAKNVYPAGSAVTFTADSKLVATFEALPEIMITFVDGTSKVAECNLVDINEKIPAMSKIGYDFTGWYLNGVKVDPLTYEFTENATLVAGWEPIKCYVTFIVNGEVFKEQTVEYGKLATEPVLPEGYAKWDYNFDNPVTKDITITAVEKAPEKPTGLADPTIKMALVVVGLFVCVLLAVIILKREDIRAGMVRKLSKADDVVEDKKE